MVGGSGVAKHAFARMPDAADLTIFIAATAAVLVVPGPSVLFIVARTLERGRGGLISVLGVETGALLHVGAATAAFRAGRLIAGRAARRQDRRRGLPARPRRARPAAVRRRRDPGRQSDELDTGRLFRQGLLIDALNPKTTMFFLAFLPQFVDPAAGSVAVQTLVLGLCFLALAMLSDGGYALVAGAVAERLRRSQAARARLRRASGAAYVGLAALAGLAPG